MWTSPQFSADLFTFTKGIIDWKLLFLCSETIDSSYQYTAFKQSTEWKVSAKTFLLESELIQGWTASNIKTLRLLQFGIGGKPEWKVNEKNIYH